MDDIHLIDDMRGRKSRSGIIQLAITNYLKQFDSNHINLEVKEIWQEDLNTQIDYHNKRYDKFGLAYDQGMNLFLSALKNSVTRAQRLEIL